MISDLHQMTVHDQDSLLATTFSFCFPFIRCILTNSAMNIEIQEKALQVLSKHCSLRMREEGIDERYSEVRSIGKKTLPYLHRGVYNFHSRLRHVYPINTGCLREKYRCLIEYSIKAETITTLK